MAQSEPFDQHLVLVHTRHSHILCLPQYMWVNRPPGSKPSLELQVNIWGQDCEVLLPLDALEDYGLLGSAAVEAASGALSRAFASAEVVGERWVRETVTPGVLAQVGCDLIRSGDSMHVIRMGGDGLVRLIPASSWHWEGSHDPDSWTVRATCYGPSTSTTWNLPASGVVFVRWGSAPGQPYTGTGPLSWAHTTARLQSEAERSLADEAGGPIANLLAIPQDGGDDSDADPLAGLKTDIRTARGKALLVETTAAGWGEGKNAAPQADWRQQRLGPNMPAAMVELARDAFMRTLAATGTPPSLFTDSDGTSQREGFRRWHLGTVLPLARLLEHELSMRLEAPIKLRFDGYPKDMVSRAQVFSKLIAAEGMTKEMALAISGLMDGEDG